MPCVPCQCHRGVICVIIWVKYSVYVFYYIPVFNVRRIISVICVITLVKCSECPVCPACVICVIISVKYFTEYVFQVSSVKLSVKVLDFENYAKAIVPTPKMSPLKI